MLLVFVVVCGSLWVTRVTVSITGERFHVPWSLALGDPVLLLPGVSFYRSL